MLPHDATDARVADGGELVSVRDRRSTGGPPPDLVREARMHLEELRLDARLGARAGGLPLTTQLASPPC